MDDAPFPQLHNIGQYRVLKMASPTPTPDPNITPAMKPPPGITPNLVDPASEAWITIMVVTLLLAFTTPFVLARMYTRHFINRRVWWDDWTCVLGYVIPPSESISDYKYLTKADWPCGILCDFV